MVDTWADSALFIEDRNNDGIVPSIFHDRRLKSRWAGKIPAPTFVYGVYATLGDPHPPFKGYGELKDYPGDRVPDTAPTSGMTTSLAQNAMAAQTPHTGYSTPNSVASSDSRDRPPHLGRDSSRTWESPSYQADVMRHRAMTPDQDRQREDSRWTHRDTGSPGYYRRPDNNYRQDRRENNDRARFHNYSLMSDDQQRARDAAADHNHSAPRRRSRSPHYRDRRTTAPRLIENPDIRTMQRGPDAHPQSRWAMAQRSGQPHAGDVTCPSPDPGYVARETARVAAAFTRPFHPRKDGTTPTRPERHESALGPWTHLSVSTIAQAYNVAALMAEGSNETYAFFKNIINTCAFAPTEFRSEGETYLVSAQQGIENSYWDAIAGPRRHSPVERTPRVHEVDDGALTHHPYMGTGYVSERANESPRFTSHSTASTSAITFGSHNFLIPTLDAGFARPTPALTPHPQPFTKKVRVISAADRPAPPPTPRPVTPSDNFADMGVSYLGTSAPNPDDRGPTLDADGRPHTGGRPNTRWTIGQALYALTRRNPNEWARGIRSFLMQQPPSRGESPYQNDVIAYYTFCALAPVNGTTPTANHQYRLFFKVGVGLFSIRGLFAHIVQLGAYEHASLPMAHYPYPTDNITIFLVAGWFIQHGISPDAPATPILEAFARARRNMQSGIADLENEAWVNEPTQASTMSLTSEQVPHWTQLAHAPRHGTPTSGITASIHAPMEGITTTEDSVPVAPSVDTVVSPPLVVPGSP
ncbi:hypothetical protein B0H12DRAFT_1081390 [Mycena haematopus]|nr:hypothetical protein B0H12DRAFT_1081390 [Mycena haematopus]